MSDIRYGKDKITGFFHPTTDVDHASKEGSIPDEIRTDYNKLKSIVDAKYNREYIKVCAFYNKMFPSLKNNEWARSTYNVPSFTSMDQEREDTGTGTASNYLKQIVDQVTSRLGTITFDAFMLSDVPTLGYIVYKDEVERILKKLIRDDELNRLMLETFHDAAILGYSHAIIHPYTKKWVKVADYEVGAYESEVNNSKIRHMVVEKHQFPKSDLGIFLTHVDSEMKEKVLENLANRDCVDVEMYFDCPNRKVYTEIEHVMLPPIKYPFEEVQMVTFSWDVGFSKVTTTSLFDLLYPVQREFNKVKAKTQQLIRLYKGPVPVFNSDVDLAMKAISNGTGECLYVDSARPVDQMMSVINPTPLDTELDAVATTFKTEMYELAGLQQMSLDMENFRSAAAVIAMDQTRDTVFQAQVDGIARFVRQIFRVTVNYNSKVEKSDNIDWTEINNLMKDAYIELKPIHINDPQGNKGSEEGAAEPDYNAMQTARFVSNVIQKKKTFDDLNYVYDKEAVKTLAAMTIVKMSALDVTCSELEELLISCFVDDYQAGAVQI